MEQRRWEDLNEDCLVNVLGRVGLESLILEVPFVCKSWYRASLNPECWITLRFTDISSLSLPQFIERFKDEYPVEKFSITGFVKLVVSRSRRSALSVFLPSRCTPEALEFVSTQCPALKVLGIPSFVVEKRGKLIPELVSKCKDLQQLYLGSTRYYFMDILSAISFYCKDFIALSARGDVVFNEGASIAAPSPNLYYLSLRSNILHHEDLQIILKYFNGLSLGDHVCNEKASAIVTFLPKIKYLWLRSTLLPCESLKIILEGCKELVLLDARDCIGFPAEDEDILKMGSHIKTFMVEGSHVDIEYAAYGGGIGYCELCIHDDDDDGDGGGYDDYDDDDDDDDDGDGGGYDDYDDDDDDDGDGGGYDDYDDDDIDDYYSD